MGRKTKKKKNGKTTNANCNSSKTEREKGILKKVQRGQKRIGGKKDQ